MIDIQKLKALAKAARGENWRAGNFYGKAFIPTYQVLADTTDGLCVVLEGNQNFLEQAEANVTFAAAANPAVVLELIAEIERQASQFKEWQASHHANYCAVAEERDQLKAENEALSKKADCVDDCAHLIRKLVHCRRQLATDGDLAEKALDYLRRKGLQGSPLRTDTQSLEPGSAPSKWTAEDEAGSKAVYEQWANLCEYVPWVEGGNSLKQDEARRLYCAIEGKEYCYGR